MNSRLKVLTHINEFIVKNSEICSKFIDSESEEKLSKEHPVVQKLSKEIFNVIFGDNIDNIKFNLKGHFRYIDKKSWGDIKKFSDLNPRLKLTKNALEEKTAFLVYFGLAEMLYISQKGLTKEELENKENFTIFGMTM